jgi:hypothetical protein
VTNVASGNWSNPATWGGSVPANTDDVTIADGTTVTIDQAVTANSLTVGQGVSGVLQYDGTARAVTVTTSVTINTGGVFQTNTAGAQTGHSLSVGTNLTNNGTLDSARPATPRVPASPSPAQRAGRSAEPAPRPTSARW